MNALSTTLAAPGAAAMIPRSMRDAMELATMMAKTGFLPQQIQTPGGALFVVEQAMRWNMSPFAVATEVSFISGKPMFSGKIVAAAVQSSGLMAGRLSYDYAGSGDDRAVTVRGTLRGEDKPREITVRVRDAKTTNQMWVKQPDQQLSYFGARAWARRHLPEVMLGVYAPEEFDEEAPQPAREVQATVVEPARPVADAAEAGLPVIGVGNGHDGVLFRVAPRSWLAAVEKALLRLESAEAVRSWRGVMHEHFAAVAEVDGLKAAEAGHLIERRLAEFAADDREPGEEG